MKIQITNLSLVNFKGIKSLSVDIDGQRQNIYGDNATGKSTIADAIMWLLFGKDLQDRKDFEVKTVDAKGNAIPRIEHEVTGTLYIDTVKVVLKRVLREKWVKKQGTTEQVFTGNETLYFVDDVPKSQKEYQDYINQVIPESTFKMLTNPHYFNNLKMADRRAMLTAIARIPDDESIAGKDLAGLLATMRNERKTLEDLRKQYSEQKKKLRAALDQIPARLDELNRNTPEMQDWGTIEDQIQGLKAQIAKIDEAIADTTKGLQERIDKNNAILKQKAAYEQELSEMQSTAARKFSEKAGEKDRLLAEIRRNIELKQQRVKEISADIDTLVRNADADSKLIEAVRAKFIAKNAEVFHIDDIATTCPTCKQELPADNIQQQKNAMAENFSKAKADALEVINKEGVAIKQRIEATNASITEKKSLVAHLDAEIIELKTKLTETEKAPAGLKPVEAILNENPRYNEVKKALSEIESPEPVTINIEDERQIKDDFQTEIEKLQAKLATKAIIEQAEKRKRELLAEEQALSAQLTEFEGLENQINDFSARKMQAVEDAVNKMFPTVRFKMFEQQINGGIADACICLVGGVPYTDANNAGRINAGLEIIDTFAKVHNMYAPIIIDNAEAVSTLYPANAQMIAMYVVPGSKLTFQEVQKVA